MLGDKARSLAKRRVGSVSELDKLKASQKENLAREQILRQLEEDNPDVTITQPSLYINTQVSWSVGRLVGMIVG